MKQIEVLKASDAGKGSKRGAVARGGAGKGGKKKRATGTVNKRSTAELAGEDEKGRHHRAPSVDSGRKGQYRFGSGKINYIKPRVGYPTKYEAEESHLVASFSSMPMGIREGRLTA